MLAAIALALAAAAALPVEGNPQSRVKVIVYEDLQCPDCAAFRQMMDQQLLPRFGSKVAFVHKDFPLSKHAWARLAAIGGRHFASVSPEIGVRWRQWIMGNIRQTTVDNFRDKIAEFAKAQGADPAAALQALDNPDYAAQVERDYQEGVARGVAKTPTVFVNGRPFIERFAFDELAAAIDQALQ